MDARQHAAVWRQAARVVKAMDLSENAPGIPAAAEQATWRAFATAASVLNRIAGEYETSADGGAH